MERTLGNIGEMLQGSYITVTQEEQNQNYKNGSIMTLKKSN